MPGPSLANGLAAQGVPNATDLQRVTRVRVNVQPPARTQVDTYSEGGYRVHILENPGARTTDAANRSVLVLGLGSNESSVQDSRYYVNPTTGRPFDVVSACVRIIPLTGGSGGSQSRCTAKSERSP
jgi:hypothetical protein